MSFREHDYVRELDDLADDCDCPCFIDKCGTRFDAEVIKSRILTIAKLVSDVHVPYDTNKLLRRLGLCTSLKGTPLDAGQMRSCPFNEFVIGGVINGVVEISPLCSRFGFLFTENHFAYVNASAQFVKHHVCANPYHMEKDHTVEQLDSVVRCFHSVLQLPPLIYLLPERDGVSYLVDRIELIENKLSMIASLPPRGTAALTYSKDSSFFDVCDNYVDLKINFMAMDFVNKVLCEKGLGEFLWKFVPVDFRLLSLIAHLRRPEEVYIYLEGVHAQFKDPNHEILLSCVQGWVDKFYSFDVVHKFLSTHRFLWCDEIFNIFSEMLSLAAQHRKIERTGRFILNVSGSDFSGKSLTFFEIFSQIQQFDLMIRRGQSIPISWFSRVASAGLTLLLDPLLNIGVSGHAPVIDASVIVTPSSKVTNVRSRKVKKNVKIGCPPLKRGRGRPRVKTLTQAIIKNESTNVIECFPVKRGRGRPPGSKSKSKDVVETVKDIPDRVPAELFGGRFRNNFVQRE